MPNAIQTASKTASRQRNTLRGNDFFFWFFIELLYFISIFHSHCSRSRMLSDKIAAAKDSVARCSRELTEEKLRETSRRDIIPKVKNLLDVYPLLETAEEKNALLKEVLEKVVYQKLNEKRKKSPDGFTIEIYPRIPKSEK